MTPPPDVATLSGKVESSMGPNIPGIQILEKLAEGGSAFIYTAQDLLTKEPRAVKVLKPEARADGKLQKAFRSEALLLQTLDHENLIKLYSAGAVGPDEYMVLELFTGSNVKRLLQQKSPDLPRLALDLFQGAADALCYLHLNGIIHKDVKPENLLVDPSTGRVKLIDLSIAEKPNRLTTSFNLFRKTTVQGTPSYMSPEQIQGKPLDHRTDVYSLGATMNEVYTGSPPFSGRSQEEILQKHLKEPFRWPRTPGMAVPEEIHRLIVTMLDKDPMRRPDMNIVLRRIAEVKTAQARLRPGPRATGVPGSPNVTPAPAPGTEPGAPVREVRLTVKDARLTFIRVRESRLSGVKEGLDGFLHNLSRAGLGFDTAIPPQMDEELDIVLVVPPINKAIRVSGVVKWVSPDSASGLNTVGVFLPKPPPDYTDQLSQLRSALAELPAATSQPEAQAKPPGDG